MRTAVYIPHTNYKGTVCTRRGCMSGSGLLLRNPGAGAASSYDGIEDYSTVTGRNLADISERAFSETLKAGKGLGLGIPNKKAKNMNNIIKKLESLQVMDVKKPKPKNITFNI